MIATRVRPLLLPLLLAAGLGACASNGVQPGIVSSSVPIAGGPVAGQSPGSPTQVAYSAPMGAGRVVSIREVGLAGTGGSYGSGNGNGALMGGIIGGGIGATLGAITSNTVGGGLSVFCSAAWAVRSPVRSLTVNAAAVAASKSRSSATTGKA